MKIFENNSQSGKVGWAVISRGNHMIRALLVIFIVMLTVQGCSQSLKEDIKDVGQDIKNSINKATD